MCNGELRCMMIVLSNCFCVFLLISFFIRAGPWWGSYMFSLEPTSSGGNQPQMDWIKNFTNFNE
jgi:hypothetical protein